MFHNEIIINVTLPETPHMSDRVYVLETASIVFLFIFFNSIFLFYS